MATATFTGGVSKVEKFTLGFDSTVTGGTSTINLTGGTLYLGSGGIVKNGTSGLTTNVNLTNGLLGADADWSSAVGAAIGGTAGSPLTIRTASDVNVAHNITFNGGFTGTGGFIKTGNGKLTIAANSTYTGGAVGTTISAGTLQVGDGGTAGTLGTSAVINNGILAFNRTDALTFANNVSGPGALEQNGTGTTTLSGTNTYAGNTTINAGTLRVASSLTSPVVTVNSTGTLGGTGALAGAVTVNNGGRLAPSDAAGTAPATLTLGSLTLSSGSILDVDFTTLSAFDKVAVTGANGLTINGVGINLYTSNTVTPWSTTGSYNLFQYTGALGGLAATNLNSALTILNPLGSLTYNFSSAGGFITLDINTVGVTPTWIATGDGSWNSAGNWNTTVPSAPDATAKFGPAISAPSTVTLDGNKTVGVIEFGNANAYTIAQGTSGTLTLSKSSGSAAVDNVAGSHTISAPVSLASPTIVTVFDAADTLTVSGAVSGANSLTKSGLGTLVLPIANSFGGGATLTAGTLRIGHNQSLGTAALTVTGNGTLQFGANNLAPANDVVVNSGATATIDTQNNSATLAGVVSGDGALNKAGSGRLVLLSSANSYNGSTTVTGGILSVDNLSDGGFPSPIGQSTNDAANLVLNGGTLEYTGTGISTDRLFRLGTVGGGLSASGTGPVQFINSGDITFAGSNTARMLTLSGTNTDANTLYAAIGNNGTGATSLTKSGAGTWNLGGTNTFSGETVISGGTLVLDNPSALGGSTLNYNNQGGVVDFGFQFQVNLGGLTGGQDLPLTNSPSLTIGGNGQNTTYSGSLTGAFSLTKAGAGTFALTGSNDFTGLGSTAISGGILELVAGGILVTPAITLTATATLFHQTGGTVTATLLDLENGNAQQHRATFESGSIATFTTTTLGATNATSAPCVLTINGGTIALGDYSSQRDGGPNFNTTAGLIINGGTVTATSVHVSTNNSWSNLTLNGGSLVIGDTASTGAFFLGGGTNNARGGNLTMTGGTLTYLGTDGLVLNQSFGSSIGQATFNGGVAKLTGITLNAATATGGSATLVVNAGTVYLGAVGLQAQTTVSTASVTLNGATLGALEPWSGTPNMTVGTNGVTFRAADEANTAHDITLSGQLSGSGSITKTGPGTLTLNGQNTYTGATVVNAGTLVLGQSLTTSSLSIADGATVQLGAAASPAEAVEATATFDWTDDGNTMQQIMAEGGDVAGVAAVPEPGALSLLTISVLPWLSRRR